MSAMIKTALSLLRRFYYSFYTAFVLNTGFVYNTKPMRRALPFLIAIFMGFIALAETTHTHTQAGDYPCPAVCVCVPCCSYSGTTVKSSVEPATDPNLVAAPEAPLFVHRISEDEIFHPPAV